MRTPTKRGAVREEFEAITDGTSAIGPEEMEAYGRLVYVGDESTVCPALRAG